MYRIGKFRYQGSGSGKDLKAHVPWIESISKVPTTFNENLMTKLGLKDLGQTLPSKSQLDFSLKILT